MSFAVSASSASISSAQLPVIPRDLRVAMMRSSMSAKYPTTAAVSVIVKLPQFGTTRCRALQIQRHQIQDLRDRVPGLVWEWPDSFVSASG